MYSSNLNFHFTGIGGVGMASIAQVLLALGFQVSGSDLRYNDLCKRLETLGARIYKGHSAQNVAADASLVVYSSAVPETNPEMLEAKKRGIPVVRRAEVLAELMRLKFGVAVGGSHGKTTTTSMVGHVLEYAKLDPTIIIGGELKGVTEGGGRVGESEYLVAESDESDKSFLILRPSVAVVTNIDNEHMSAYASQTDLLHSFESFVSSVPFYGLAVMCADCPKTKQIAERLTRRVITYGFHPDSELRVENVSSEQLRIEGDVYLRGELLGRIQIPQPGRHSILNALASIAVALEFEVPFETIQKALSSFPGVKRRLEVVGDVCGVKVMSDYGHHPTEIKATLAALKACALDGRILVVFQPHRYSRTKECFTEFISSFHDGDMLALTEIYAAGEEPIEGIDAGILLNAIEHNGKELVSDLDSVPRWVKQNAKAGDVVICMGAGSIGSIPQQIVDLYSTIKEPEIKGPEIKEVA